MTGDTTVSQSGRKGIPCTLITPPWPGPFKDEHVVASLDGETGGFEIELFRRAVKTGVDDQKGAFCSLNGPPDRNTPAMKSLQREFEPV